MIGSAAGRRIQGLLVDADVEVDGDRPWDIQVHDARVYSRTLRQGSLGLGEAYVEGWWDAERLDQLFYRVLRAGLDSRVAHRAAPFYDFLARIFNFQSRRRSAEVGRRHYDIGNDLFEAMLDERMIYSCGYWKDAGSLDEAQEAKLDLVCQKLAIEPGMRVLDIGCGWGGTAAYIATRYDASVVGISISKEQVEEGRRRCAGLDVEIRMEDYRALEDRFDRILSIGMFEHVGQKNYRTFFETVRRCLEPGGRALLHTIGGKHSVVRTDPWLARYIFPNSMLPSASQITAAAEGSLVLDDWHSFGPDYDRTLMAWHRNFVEAWPHLGVQYDDRFFRMWSYYLLSCAGSFRAGKGQVWQILLSPSGLTSEALERYRESPYARLG